MSEKTPNMLRAEADVERLAGHRSQAAWIDEAASDWEADRKRLGKLADFIRGNCYKHGRGDDACSCEWLEETLREAE